MTRLEEWTLSITKSDPDYIQYIELQKMIIALINPQLFFNLAKLDKEKLERDKIRRYEALEKIYAQQLIIIERRSPLGQKLDWTRPSSPLR